MEHTTECTVSGWCRCSDWADEEGNKLLANLDLKAIDNNTNIFDEETDLLFEQLNIKRIIANAKLAHLVGCNKKEDTCEGNMWIFIKRCVPQITKLSTMVYLAY